jgi:replicative DNA helicase
MIMIIHTGENIMESPMEIWDDIEEAREKLRLKRRQISGGDIEDEIVLKTKSLIYLADEAFELMEDTLEKVQDKIVDEVVEPAEKAPEAVVEEIKELRSTINEKRKLITLDKMEDKAEDVWDDIEERFERIMGRIKKK